MNDREASSSGIKIGGVAARAASDDLKPPLVSFIVRNWNYGRYVGQAIDSIRSQDYPRFEAIVVDNGSSDDSRDVIARHVDGDPRFSVVHSEINLGPMGGALLALKSARGDFVTFVDADDTLLPHYASSHIQVHLAAARSVAFTSSTAIETSADNAVLSGRSQQGQPRSIMPLDALRPAALVPRLDTVDTVAFDRLASHTSLLEPVPQGWPWSPGTGNMYRRVVLDLVAPISAPLFDRLSCDGHYNRLAHMLGSSAIIDVPLSTYRIHGENYYAPMPTVDAMRSGSGPAGKLTGLRVFEEIRVVAARAAEFSWRIGEARFWQALCDLVEVAHWPARGAPSRAELTSFLRDQFSLLAETFGEQQTAAHLAKSLPSDLLAEIIPRHDDPPPPPPSPPPPPAPETPPPTGLQKLRQRIRDRLGRR